jgi:hypothetical protein
MIVRLRLSGNATSARHARVPWSSNPSSICWRTVRSVLSVKSNAQVGFMGKGPTPISPTLKRAQKRNRCFGHRRLNRVTSDILFS